MVGRRTSQMHACETRQSFYCLLIRTVQLCPSFLKEKGPQFLRFRVKECGKFCFWIDWNIIINNNRCSKTIYEHFDLVNTSCIDVFSDNKSIDSFIMISHCVERCQEVVVSCFPLFQIVCSVSVFLYDSLLGINFTEPLPCQGLIELNFTRIQVVLSGIVK